MHNKTARKLVIHIVWIINACPNDPQNSFKLFNYSLKFNRTHFNQRIPNVPNFQQEVLLNFHNFQCEMSETKTVIGNFLHFFFIFVWTVEFIRMTMSAQQFLIDFANHTERRVSRWVFRAQLLQFKCSWLVLFEQWICDNDSCVVVVVFVVVVVIIVIVLRYCGAIVSYRLRRMENTLVSENIHKCKTEWDGMTRMMYIMWMLKWKTLFSLQERQLTEHSTWNIIQ